MSATEKTDVIDPLESSLSMRELTELLVRHYGKTEGTYELFCEFTIGTGPVGPNSEDLIPGAMIGISRVGLRPASASAPRSLTVDAATAVAKTAKPAAKKPKVTEK